MSSQRLKYLNLTELSDVQVQQYRDAVSVAFPKIIQSSEVIKNNWGYIEDHFPKHQLYLIGADDNLIGFMNTVPIHYDQSLDQLPNEGWDWLVHKSISDHKLNKAPNTLGGLQVIITKKNQRKGYSKFLIAEAKNMMQKNGYEKFVIPIRPTLKQNYPDMSMVDYLHLKNENKIYDPWIRTHVDSNAKVISICHKSMNIKGDIKFWENLMNQKIKHSGYHQVSGALNPVYIHLDSNKGEYYEENIWIAYE